MQLTNIPYCGFPFCPNSYTDNNPFQGNSNRYAVWVQAPAGCNSTRTSVNTSRSNIKKPSTIVTGLKTELTAAIAVYPNPANGNVMIELPVEIRQANVTIHNMVGQLLYVESISSSGNNKTTKTIDISTYAKGIYAVTTENSGNKIYKKRVVN